MFSAGPGERGRPGAADSAAVTAVTALDAGGSELSLNSVVEVDLSPGRTMCGTVRWIGTLPDMSGTRVGLELVRELAAAPCCSSGTLLLSLH